VTIALVPTRRRAASRTLAKASGSTSSSASGVAGLTIDYASLTGTLNGSGSSFQDVFDQKVISDFKSKAAGVSVSYTKSGSSAGKQDLQNAVVQFAGTDSLIKDADKAKYKGSVLYFPTVAAPITVSYNVSGLSKLQLSPETLAGIMMTTISTWNDPKIAADNPGVALPSTKITVVHRSDGSGTTSNFTKFLKVAAPSVWTLDSGDTVNWAASTQGAEKNSGVASAIKGADGAIGYVDLADAVNAGLSTALVKNKAGKFVEPKLPGASAAVKGTTVNADLTYDPINAAGDDAYPITSPTWIIVYQQQSDAAKKQTLVDFLRWALTDGQAMEAALDYAPLPDSMRTALVERLGEIN